MPELRRKLGSPESGKRLSLDIAAAFCQLKTMHAFISSRFASAATGAKVVLLTLLGIGGLAGSMKAAEPSPPAFEGHKTSWHGFDRFDFLLDQETLAITPTEASSDEGSGFRHRGQSRRCIIVVPKEAAPGNPWSWRGCYWDHQPQTEVELLRRGFCIGYVESSSDLRPDKTWDAWYAFLTEKHGLSPKPAFVGMSRGGEFAYTWGTAHPDKVSCIYADNPGGNWGVMARLAALATNDVPLLHVCGSFDPILGKFTLPMESMYQQFGGRISVMIKEGRGHHPHSLRDPKPIADFIEQSVRETTAPAPDFAGTRFTRTRYYSAASAYRNFPSEGTYITLRGPFFSECYDRYQFDLPGIEGTLTVITPKTAAPGNPWVFQADFVDRDATVDQALLAKGYHIVTGAVPYNADGPSVEKWNDIYNYLTSHGFSKKAVMQGAGGAAGKLMPGRLKIQAKSPAFTRKIHCCTATPPKRSRSTISNLWPKPACRSSMFAAATTPCWRTTRAWRKNGIKSLAVNSPSSSTLAPATTHSRRKTQRQ